MCPPKIPQPKTAMPTTPPPLPEEGPRELKVKKDKTTSTRINPLRIDLATKNAPGVAGVNI